MVDLAHNWWSLEIEQWNCLKVQQVSDDLGALLVNFCWYQVALHVLCSACSERVISSIFNKCDLTCVWNHAQIISGEIKLFITGSFPVDLTWLSRVSINDDKGFISVTNSVSIMMEIDFVDFVSIVAFHDALFSTSLDLNDNLTGGNIV